jgi:glycosyltransferase involved in cell wall biosynthesis
LGARVGFGDILHNPVDTRVFVPVATRLPGPPTLLLAGSHQHAYRVRAALETLRHLSAHFPEARLLVAGRYAWKGPREAEARGEAEAMAHELGVRCRVEIRGAYTQEESPALLQSAHVLLHTKYNDPCPRLVVEAMACGLPVAFSASGGVPELVGDEAGIGVPAPLDWDRDHPPAPAALAAAAARVINDLARYSQAARRRATQRFDVTAWVQRHTEVFRRLAGGS